MSRPNRISPETSTGSPCITTWVLNANSTRASVLFNTGPGRGLILSRQRQWRAPHRPSPSPAKISQSDLAEVMIRNPHARQIRAAVEFAQTICANLRRDFDEGLFERLVIVADMTMLHNLNAALDPTLRGLLAGVVAKDLTGETLDRIESEVGRFLEI